MANLIPLAVAASVVLTGGAAYLFWDGLLLSVDQGFVPASHVDICDSLAVTPYDEEELEAANGILRLRFTTVGEAADVVTCVYDESHQVRYREAFRIDAGAERLFEFPVAAGDVYAPFRARAVFSDSVGGSGGNNIDLGWCPTRAAKFEFTLDYTRDHSGTIGMPRECTSRGDLTNPSGGEIDPASGPAVGWLYSGPGGGAVIAGGLAVLVAGAAWSHWGTLKPFVARLYSRVRRPTVLDHELRSEILEVVRSSPEIGRAHV